MIDYIDIVLIFIEGDDNFRAKVIRHWAFSYFSQLDFKMKTRLFLEDTESYTIEANQIANEFDRAIRAVFDKYNSMYYTRELEVIAISSVSMAACKSVMDRQHVASEARKAEMVKNLSDPNLADKVRAHAAENYTNSSVPKIDAIKSCRILTGLGLKESKEWVEANMSEFPEGFAKRNA
jgi:ribosomal protein L7/L12